MPKLFKAAGVLITAVFFLSSCTTAPLKPPAPQSAYIYSQIPQTAIRQNTFHVVAPGETLWRISKMYDVNIGDIMSANNLKESSKLKMGQKIIIPNASQVKRVEVPLYNTNRWKYIIIHHSATDTGDALTLFKMHLRRGFWQGLGYQFTIANGTCGKDDGQIEISPRWLKQQDGAHCKADGMNHKGIGICLVGNFSRENVSSKQMDSLVYLVNILRKQYKIPVENILGHGQVPGAHTECPGKNFPWDEFYLRLKAG